MRLCSQGGDYSFIVIRVQAAQYKYASIFIIIIIKEVHIVEFQPLEDNINLVLCVCFILSSQG